MPFVPTLGLTTTVVVETDASLLGKEFAIEGDSVEQAAFLTAFAAALDFPSIPDGMQALYIADELRKLPDEDKLRIHMLLQTLLEAVS